MKNSSLIYLSWLLPLLFQSTFRISHVVLCWFFKRNYSYAFWDRNLALCSHIAFSWLHLLLSDFIFCYRSSGIKTFCFKRTSLDHCLSHFRIWINIAKKYVFVFLHWLKYFILTLTRDSLKIILPAFIMNLNCLVTKL